MKLCKDCIYRQWSIFGLESYKCKHPSLVSPVSGNAVTFCETEREYGRCGRDGTLFEPKKSFSQKALSNG